MVQKTGRLMRINLQKAFILSLVMKQVLKEEGEPVVDLFPYLLKTKVKAREEISQRESGSAFMRRMAFARSLANYTNMKGETLITKLSGPPEKEDDMMIFKFKEKTKLTIEDIDLQQFRKNLLDHAGMTGIIVLDFTNVISINKVTMGKLISLQQSLGKDERCLAIVGPQADILEKFQVTKLDKLFNICKTLNELKLKIGAGLIKIYTSKKVYS